MENFLSGSGSGLEKIMIWFVLRGWIRIGFVLRYWIRIRLVLRGWIQIRTISDQIHNPASENSLKIGRKMYASHIHKFHQIRKFKIAKRKERGRMTDSS